MLTPTVIWLIIGIGLCMAELILPTAFMAFVMGISALAVALIAPVLPQFGLQIALWMGLSLISIFLSRRFIKKTKASARLDAMEAETLTEIPAGRTGRVLYEGNSWQAKCEDDRLAILPQQKVYVVRREGTTLIVVPQLLLEP